MRPIFWGLKSRDSGVWQPPIRLMSSRPRLNPRARHWAAAAASNFLSIAAAYAARRNHGPFSFLTTSLTSFMAAGGLAQHCPTVTMQELPHGDGWIMVSWAWTAGYSSQNCTRGCPGACSVSDFASGPPSS
jgi:hypothetical protein